ncbi:Pentatricopeptide repeat-containing protein At4g16470 [Linum grandiflorum]
MFSISRMKALLPSPSSCCNTAPATYAAVSFSSTAPKSTILCDSSVLPLPIYPFLSHAICSSGLPAFSESPKQNFLPPAACHSASHSSGEIHTIVSPALIRHVQSEKRNRSFQVRNSHQLNRTLQGLCFSGRLDGAVSLLWSNGSSSSVGDGTYSLMLQECILGKQYNIGRKIHAQMVIVGYVPSEYLRTKLLILYAKSGDLRTATVFFDELMEKSLISWNAMISGYVQNGHEEAGLGHYCNMRQNGFTPDQYTFASVFRACGTLASFELGRQAHGVMIKIHLKDNVVVNSALIDMYFKCSNLVDGQKVFDESLNRNVVTWTSLISGYGQHGKVSEVLDLFQKMKDEGFRPNYVTFLAVLSACSHGGLVDQGWAYFSSMKDYGIKPKGKHYAAMVDVLGRAGRLQEAYNFVLSSPLKEHSAIWGALLGACRIHGDMKLASVAAAKFFKLEPDNAGKYVVLSNAYATSGFWNQVQEVRGTMRDFGITKEPAYSWVEIQGEVHIFLTRDMSRVNSQELLSMVLEITSILKDADYAPDVEDH